jgi:hypothetical protein
LVYRAERTLGEIELTGLNNSFKMLAQTKSIEGKVDQL